MNTPLLRILPLFLTLCAGVSAQQDAPPPPPVLTMKDFARVQSDMRIQATRDLERIYPRYKAGDPMHLTTPRGMVIKGTYKWASTNHIEIVTDTGRPTPLPLVELTYPDRIRSDPAVRSEYIDVNARTKTRMMIEAAGTRPHTFAATNAEGLEYLLACGDPDALVELGMTIARGRKGVAPDPSAAAMYFEAAALAGNAKGMTALGRMHYTGIGMPRIPARGLVWLAAAESMGSSEASNFLAQTGAKSNDRARALAAYKEKHEELDAVKKQETDKYIAEWKARLEKLIVPGTTPVVIAPGSTDPRTLHLVRKDGAGEYYFKDGKKIYFPKAEKNEP